MSDLSLQGKTALVTGGGRPRGIGHAIAKALVAQGAQVLITDLPGVTSEEDVSARFGDKAQSVAFFEADVTSPENAKDAVAETVRRFGALDILVNNAGVGRGSSDFLELTDSDWAVSLNVNLRGVANFCAAALPSLRAAGAGVIINVASLSGLRAIPLIPACYTASKFAVIGLTKQLALQLAPEGIRVNAVCPGSVRTDMMQTVMEDIAAAEGISVDEAEAFEAATIALGRAAEPEEIGNYVAALAGPSAAYVTGEALSVSGGMFNGI